LLKIFSYIRDYLILFPVKFVEKFPVFQPLSFSKKEIRREGAWETKKD